MSDQPMEPMTQNLCELCGEPMPPGEEMFKFHGYSGPCPKPPLKLEPQPSENTAAPAATSWEKSLARLEADRAEAAEALRIVAALEKLLARYPEVVLTNYVGAPYGCEVGDETNIGVTLLEAVELAASELERKLSDE